VILRLPLANGSYLSLSMMFFMYASLADIYAIFLHFISQETHNAQASFSSESVPTVWKTIPTLECLQQNWETLANTPKFAPVKHGIEKGLEKLKKWYMATDQMDIHFICLGMLQNLIQVLIALELSIKLEYAKQKWDKVSYDKGVVAFEKVVRHN
jgi:hypothetical protein